jgi:hypothetical protein
MRLPVWPKRAAVVRATLNIGRKCGAWRPSVQVGKKYNSSVTEIHYRHILNNVMNPMVNS